MEQTAIKDRNFVVFVAVLLCIVVAAAAAAAVAVVATAAAAAVVAHALAKFLIHFDSQCIRLATRSKQHTLVYEHVHP